MQGAFIVAPYAGAWIEIMYNRIGRAYMQVAPYAGAWIEMGIGRSIYPHLISRSLRGSVD